MILDPHVHLRDGQESRKETIRHALFVAERAGLTLVIDMPNTAPPILTRQRALRRVLVARECESVVQYGL